MDDLKQTLCEIQDYLAPQLNGLEQMVYHYLFRHTHLLGKDTMLVPARSVGAKIGKGRTGAAELSRNSIPRKLRTLEKKGAIKILRRTHNGTEVRVFLPRDISGLIPALDSPASTDLTTVDFFSVMENRLRILARDELKCCYCLRPIDSENFTLDHIVPQTDGGDNSYKNLLTACFECNSRKNFLTVDDFLRANYRAHLLNSAEFDACVQYVVSVQAGKVIPS